MKTLILHGYLKELIPDGLKVDCKRPYEALRFLGNHPAIKKKAGSNLIQVEVKDLNVETWKTPCGDMEIHVYPTLAGAGNNGIGKIIVGALMVVGAVMTSGASLTMSGIGATLGAGGWAGFVSLMGVNMMLQGAMELFFYPKPNSEENPEDSDYIAANRNTTRSGTPIPLAYGHAVRLDGHLLSLNVDTKVELEATEGVLTYKS